MQNTAKRQHKAITDNIILLTVILLALWGSFAAVSKLALSSLDSFQLQFYMFGMAAILLCVILTAKGRLRELFAMPKTEVLKLIAISVPSYLYYFLYTLSLKKLPAIEASSLNYLFPILIVLFAVPINGEKFSALKVIALLAGFAGTLIILSDGKLLSLKMTNIEGDLLAISGAVSFALFTNFLKRNKADMLLSNTVFALSSFLLSVISLMLFSSFTLPALPVLGYSFWLGATNLVFGLFVWNRLIKTCSSSLSANISFLTPFSTLLFILLLLGEKISAFQLVGLFVIVFGIFLTSFAETRAKKQNK